MDDLIARLRARAQDPAGRTEARPSAFTVATRQLEFGGLLRGLAGARADLDRAVAASQAGRIDPEIHDAARRTAAAMSSPAPSELPSPADRKMGLPEVGWERVVWGGLGLEDNEPG